MADQFKGTVYSQNGNYYQLQNGQYMQFNANQVQGGLQLGSGGYNAVPIPNGAMTVPIGGTVNGVPNTGVFQPAPVPTVNAGAASGSSITSSMLGPAFENYNGALGKVNDQNSQNYTASVNSANANNAAAQAAIAFQTASGQQQLGRQADQVREQAQNISSGLTATLAANSPSGGFGSTAAADYQNTINQKTQQSLAMISQAQQLLALQGTAEEQQANATAASQIMTAAQNQMNNTMQIAGAEFTAATQTANAQLQAQQFDMQSEQFKDTKQQYQDSMDQQNKQFAVDNDIKTSAYSLGGQIYDSATGKAVTDPDKIHALYEKQQVQQVSASSKQALQYVTNLATSYPDARINLTDPVNVAQEKILHSKMYQAAVTSMSSGKPVTKIPTVIAKYLSPRVNAPAYDTVESSISQMIASSPINFSAMTSAEKYSMWGQVADAIDSAGRNVSSPLYGLSSSDFDALLWSSFAPQKDGADGLSQYIKQYKIDTSKPTGATLILGSSPSGVVNEAGSVSK